MRCFYKGLNLPCGAAKLNQIDAKICWLKLFKAIYFCLAEPLVTLAIHNHNDGVSPLCAYNSRQSNILYTKGASQGRVVWWFAQALLSGRDDVCELLALDYYCY